MTKENDSGQSHRPRQFRVRPLEELPAEEKQALREAHAFKGRRHCITPLIEALYDRERVGVMPESSERKVAESLTHCWPGRSSTGSVILPLSAVDLIALPATLTQPEVTLRRKDEAHLTLLSTRESAALSARLPESAWRETFDEMPWNITLLPAFDLLCEERPGEATRWSVIRHLACPSLNLFRQRLSALTGVDLPETLPHVTLYVGGHERGIGLASLTDHARFLVRSLDQKEWP